MWGWMYQNASVLVAFADFPWFSLFFRCKLCRKSCFSKEGIFLGFCPNSELQFCDGRLFCFQHLDNRRPPFLFLSFFLAPCCLRKCDSWILLNLKQQILEISMSCIQDLIPCDFLRLPQQRQWEVALSLLSPDLKRKVTLDITGSASHRRIWHNPSTWALEHAAAFSCSVADAVSLWCIWGALPQMHR